MNQTRVFESRVRVRYAETDAEGVVYYANHFVYMEVGRIDFLRDLGIDRAFWQRAGIGLVIVEASCRYHAPAHFDDVLVIRTSLEEVRRSSFSMRYQILNLATERLLAEGRTVQVFVDLKTMRAMRLPPEAYELLSAAALPKQDAVAPPGPTTPLAVSPRRAGTRGPNGGLCPPGRTANDGVPVASAEGRPL